MTEHPAPTESGFYWLRDETGRWAPAEVRHLGDTGHPHCVRRIGESEAWRTLDLSDAERRCWTWGHRISPPYATDRSDFLPYWGPNISRPTDPTCPTCNQPAGRCKMGCPVGGARQLRASVTEKR